MSALTKTQRNVIIPSEFSEAVFTIFRDDTRDDRDERIVQILNTAYQSLKDGLFEEAIGSLEKALEIDMDSPGVASALKAAGFWKERQEKERVGMEADPEGMPRRVDLSEASREGFEKGEWLLAQWKLFHAFAERLADVPERCMFAVKQYVFSSALACYLASAHAEPGGDPDVLLQIGRCCKGIGNYERAIENLERANLAKREDARIVAELADCYSLVNETRAAKVFFREAFFLDPQAIDIGALESPLVVRLAARLRDMGFTGPDLNEWMPVYGSIWGVFNVKREMKPVEFGRLKQSIYQLEREMHARNAAGGADARSAAAGGFQGFSRGKSVPRLINRYFWLIDHYMNAGEQRERIDEVLDKIRELDPRVHREYTS